MARPAHPLRARALQMMRRGLATPSEIAAAGQISADLVRNWRARARITTEARRLAHVRMLLRRKPRIPAMSETDDDAPF